MLLHGIKMLFVRLVGNRLDKQGHVFESVPYDVLESFKTIAMSIDDDLIAKVHGGL
jgi:hypothetical protein